MNATAIHLRSSSNPKFSRTRVGRIYVWTECGIECDAIIVDNEFASCPTCNTIDRSLA